MGKRKIKHGRKQAKGTTASGGGGELATALRRYAGNGPYAVPDYTGFSAWFYGRMEEQRSSLMYQVVNPLYRGDLQQGHSLLAEFAVLFAKLKRRLTDSGGRVRDALDPELPKFKLLLSIYTNARGRFRDTVDMIGEALSGERMPESSLDDCSPAQLRYRLFEMLKRNKEHAAFKILGKLRESDHDEGELAYLEALCCFKANEFAEAIELASKISSSHLDYIAARALLLESQAQLGDAEAVCRTILDTEPDKLSMAFVAYLLQLLLNNTAEPERCYVQISRQLKEWIGARGPIEADTDPALAMYSRYSSSIVIELLERLQDEVELIAAMRQSGIESVGGVDGAEAGAILETAGADAGSDGEERGTRGEAAAAAARRMERFGGAHELRMKQLLSALSVDGELFASLTGSPGEPIYAPILKRLLNTPYPPTFEDYYLAFMAQYRLGGRAQFVDNICGNLKKLADSGISDERVWELISLAHREAVAMEHSAVRKLERALQAWPGYAQHKIEAEKLAESAKWLQQLSPMARNSYGSSCYFLEQAKLGGYRWRDGSLISLGFFRILEMELNLRLIRPLRDTLPVAAVKGAYEADVQLLTEAADDKTREKYEAFWQPLVKKLTAALQSSPPGNGAGADLDLGMLERLFGKIGKLSGPAVGLGQLLLDKIGAEMSEAGRLALANAELPRLIDAAARDRYRNPPAHARFVPLDIAEECRRYVEDALGKIVLWTQAE